MIRAKLIVFALALPVLFLGAFVADGEAQNDEPEGTTASAPEPGPSSSKNDATGFAGPVVTQPPRRPETRRQDDGITIDQRRRLEPSQDTTDQEEHVEVRQRPRERQVEQPPQSVRIGQPPRDPR